MKNNTLWFLLGFLWGVIVTIVIILIITNNPSMLN